MREDIRAFLFLLLVIFFGGIFLFVLGWTGYSPYLRTYTDLFKNQISPSDEEIVSLQKREMELISEIENQKILDAIKEQQEKLEEQQKKLAEKEKNLEVLATALEEEKNNFLKAQEIDQQMEKEKTDYQQKVIDLAKTFISMPPQKSVERIIALKDDLLIIDVMKQIDKNAEEGEQLSITPLYYSLMDEKDASRILKKSTVTF